MNPILYARSQYLSYFPKLNKKFNLKTTSIILLKIVVGIFFGLILIFSAFTNTVAGEFDKKACIAKIPKDAGTALTNKMRRDCEDKESKIDMAVKYKPKIKGNDDVFDNEKHFVRYCEELYPIYKKGGEKYFIRMSTHGYSQYCVQLYKDDIWNYKGTDRDSVLTKKVQSLVEKNIQKTTEAKRKDPTQKKEDLSKRIAEFDKKMKALEEEGKRIKQEIEKMNAKKKLK